MEKEIGKVDKNEITQIIVRIDDYKGKPGITIREFVRGDNYTGFTKSGTRIPADKFLEFRELINSVKIDDLTLDKKKEKNKKLEPEEADEESEDGEEIEEEI